MKNDTRHMPRKRLTNLHGPAESSQEDITTLTSLGNSSRTSTWLSKPAIYEFGFGPATSYRLCLIDAHHLSCQISSSSMQLRIVIVSYQAPTDIKNDCGIMRRIGGQGARGKGASRNANQRKHTRNHAHTRKRTLKHTHTHTCSY